MGTDDSWSCQGRDGEGGDSAAIKGTSFGAPTNGEVELAELIQTAVPSMEMMRMVNSGTEAVMSAIRAARGYTGRDYIVKFEAVIMAIRMACW